MSPLRTFILLATVAALVVPAVATAYVSGGTFVVKTEFGTIVDNGGVVCRGTSGDGIGGGCLPFPAGETRGVFIRVADDVAGAAVAFQVCIDNNGDGICGGPIQQDACQDQIFFSHNDEGRFFNALGPLPKSFLQGCAANGGFAGYVVLLCTGAHEVRGTAHTHSLTQGAIGFAPFGTGYGNFCGGGGAGGETGLGQPAVAKAYTVV
jgi:hypothetical protein